MKNKRLIIIISCIVLVILWLGLFIKIPISCEMWFSSWGHEATESVDPSRAPFYECKNISLLRWLISWDYWYYSCGDKLNQPNHFRYCELKSLID